MASSLSLGDLLDRTWERLGRVTGYYAQDELILNGLNPAQNLLVLLDPTLLRKRALVSLIAKEAFIDLTVAAPRCIAMHRVVIGDVSADDPTRSQGLMGELHPCTRAQLRWRREWWRTEGTPKLWYWHGRRWIGVSPRPAVAMTFTLIYTGLPRAFTDTDMGAVSELAATLHPLIADIAAALCLVKEGQIEAARAMQLLQNWVGEEPLAPMRKALARLTRDSVMHQQVPVTAGERA